MAQTAAVLRELFAVQLDQLDGVWPHVAPELQRAVERSDGRYEVEDVRAAIEAGEMNLWIVLAGHDLEMVLVTQIIDYPRKRLCALPFIAGRNRREWMHFLEEIGKFAEERGCMEFEGYARKGWLKDTDAAGWRQLWTTIGKPIDEIDLDNA